MNTVKILKEFNKKNAQELLTPEEKERQVEEHFQKIYAANGGKQINNSSAIPKFYHKLPSDEDLLAQKIREESRAAFLQKKGRELLDNEELKALWMVLNQHQSPPLGGSDTFINYQDFLEVKSKVGPKAKPFFTAKVFGKLLQTDPYGRISLMHLFNYIMGKVWLNQTRIGLSLYDVTGQGYLCESDLGNYILELIPTLHQVMNGLEKSFHSFYVSTAVRKFFFFLDPLKTNRVRIQDILCCSFLDDLLELRSEELSKEAQQSNWFSAPSALRVYGQYLNLDSDHNGMLSPRELASYGTGTLTTVFINRLFQECVTYNGEMDYKTYLDFVLALENKKEPQALQYFFRILDIRGQGYLDVFTLHFFFRAIQDQIRTLSDQKPVEFEDVKDEIFDMVNPEESTRITLQDLIRCKQGDTVVSILIDLNGFWSYENRELFPSEVSEEAHV